METLRKKQKMLMKTMKTLRKKAENAHYEHFLLLTQCFPKSSAAEHINSSSGIEELHYEYYQITPNISV